LKYEPGIDRGLVKFCDRVMAIRGFGAPVNCDFRGHSRIQNGILVDQLESFRMSDEEQSKVKLPMFGPLFLISAGNGNTFCEML